MLCELIFREDFDEGDILNFARGIGAEASDMAVKNVPNRRHWHLRKKGISGTLEITWCPKTQRFWGEVRGNRGGEWTSDALAELQKCFCTPA